MNYKKTLEKIRKNATDYLKKYPNIKTLVIGVSGGMDSAMNCFILRPVCDELGIKLIGRYIHIETNKQEEKNRALNVGKAFCNNFDAVDLTQLYKKSLPIYELGMTPSDDIKTKTRRGNIKARMRMIYLYNLAQENSGIVIDNDNKSEHELGFWTLNGDVGDITPMSDLWKSDVYNLAKWVTSRNKSIEYFDSLFSENAIRACIYAVPTDGLGITSSDLEQFGAESYDQVDEILKEKDKFTFTIFGYRRMVKKHGYDIVKNILSRQKNSEFKRNHPYKIKLT